jgi:hypothetical protein
MSEQNETLVQRFLDAELNRAERQALLRLLGSRPDLRQRLLDDEAMLDGVASLPRAVPAPDFGSRVMAALPAQDSASPPAPGPRTRFRVPRTFMAAAASLLLAIGFWVGRVSDGRTSPPDASVAADSGSTVLVRLVLVDPQARSVSVAGDFNGWDPARTPLERTEGGLWTAMLPLESGRYHYMFFVDGQTWVPDPFAAETSLDGFGAQNSVLDVEL